MSPEPRALVVIPAFNEGQRLPRLLDGAVPELARRPDLDVVVADDGSREEDARQMREAVARAASALGAGSGRLELVRHPQNRGKGAVLRAAFRGQAEARTHDVVGFLDADGSTTFADFVRLVDLLRAHADSVDAYLGCRLKCLGVPVERNATRHAMGRVFATMVSHLFAIPVYDSQCGAKVFKASLLTQSLLELCDDDRWLFDTQLVISLWWQGARLRESPVPWRETAGGKVSLLSDPPRMFLGLWRFRRRLLAHGMCPPARPL